MPGRQVSITSERKPMIKIQQDLFSIRQICESGQCFRLRPMEENHYSLVALGRYLELAQEGDAVTFYCSPEEYGAIWKNYFDLDADYGRYQDLAYSGGAYLTEAAGFGRGIRILRQDLWEMTASFIISQQNNIKRIKKCIDFLSERYGEKKYSGDKAYYDFPKAAVLADADLDGLCACNLGYRSRYIRETARSVRDREISWDSLADLDYTDAKAELMKLSGVGTKVADCICLFGLHHLDAFPIDTHIRQVLDKEYPDGFPYESFPGFSGILQQYIFYYDLKKGEISR
jgi:N-glycosylase/DNA lyase